MNKKQFRLIIDSKVEDADSILDYAKINFSSDFIIITNNQFLKNELNKKSDHCKSVLDLVPIDSPQEITSFQNAFDSVSSFVSMSTDVKYKKITTVSMIKNRIVGELIFLEQIHYILTLNHDKNVILCLSPWNYYHFSCIDVAEMLGFEIELPLIRLNEEFTILQPNRIVEHTKILKTLYDKKLLQRLIAEHDKKEQQFHFLEQFKFFIGKRPTLFFLSTNNFDLYLKPVYPIISEFDDHKFPYLIFTTNIRAKQVLIDKKISFIDILSLVDCFKFDGENELRKTITKIRDITVSLKPSVLSCFCRYLLNDAIFFEIIEKFKIARFYSEIISLLKPTSIFVMPAETDDAEILCNVGKENKIKTVTTIAGQILPNIRSTVPNPAEIITCYGIQAVEAYQGMGYKNKLVITGNPFYDSIKKIDVKNIKSSIIQRFKIDFTKPVILVATSSIDKNEKLWMKELLKLAKEKNYEVILKFHPGIEIDDPQKNLELYNKDLQLIQKTDVADFIAVSDMLIVDYSTTGITATLYDKPIIVANFTGKPFPFIKYDEMGIALLATSVKELESCIEKILSDKEVQEEMREARLKYQIYFNYKNDGMAAARIFELLTKIDRHQSILRWIRR